MKIECVQKNLFDMPHGYCFAHCISEDFALGAGIAAEFEKRYNMRIRLKDRCETTLVNYVGEAIKIDNVFNLITKKRCYDKPTYNDLKNSLECMARYIEVNEIKYLAMPKIGAGLDKLSWNIVFFFIKEVFKDIDVNITICFLEGDPDFPTEDSKEIQPLNDYFRDSSDTSNYPDDYDYSPKFH